MDPVADLAAVLRPEPVSRVTGGVVVAVIDASHVRVDLGGMTVGAWWPASLGAASVGVAVRVHVGGGITEVVSASSLAAVSWVAPTLTNSWANYGGAATEAGYRRVGDVVEVRGVVKSGTVNTAIFNLPAGFRPATDTVFAVPAGPGGARLDVGWTGDVSLVSYYASGTNAIVSLAGVRFSTL